MGKRLDLSELIDALKKQYFSRLKDKISNDERFDISKMELSPPSFHKFSKSYKTGRFYPYFFDYEGKAYEIYFAEIYTFNQSLRAPEVLQNIEKETCCDISISESFATYALRPNDYKNIELPHTSL